MNYLHSEVDVGSNDVVEVSLDGQANVLLMDGGNFSKYQNGQPYHYYGGLAKVSPVHLRPPHAGHWHVVVDLGGYAGTIRAAVGVRKPAARTG